MPEDLEATLLGRLSDSDIARLIVSNRSLEYPLAFPPVVTLIAPTLSSKTDLEPPLARLLVDHKLLLGHLLVVPVARKDVGPFDLDLAGGVEEVGDVLARRGRVGRDETDGHAWVRVADMALVTQTALSGGRESGDDRREGG